MVDLLYPCIGPGEVPEAVRVRLELRRGKSLLYPTVRCGCGHEEAVSTLKSSLRAPGHIGRPSLAASDDVGRSEYRIAGSLANDRREVRPILYAKGLAFEFTHWRQLRRIPDKENEGVRQVALDVPEQVLVHHAAFIDNHHIGGDRLGAAVSLEDEAVYVWFRLQAEYALDGAARHALNVGLGQLSCKNGHRLVCRCTQNDSSLVSQHALCEPLHQVGLPTTCMSSE